MSSSIELKVVQIVRDAGGQFKGRTRLQKTAYLLMLAGYPIDCNFSYKHYGPYSEELATAARRANLLGFLREREEPASWGGFFSVYEADEGPVSRSEVRRNLIKTAARSNAVELELAATAAFLAKEGYEEPWKETARRKPEKAENGRLDGARKLYGKLAAMRTPRPLPPIV